MYKVVPYATDMPPFAWYEGAFSEGELSLIQEKAKQSSQTGQVGGNGTGETVPEIRRSQISWISHSPETEWIFAKLSHVVSDINSKFFHFDLTGFGEPIQLTNYDSAEQGMYGWHTDYNALISRKISVVLQLSDPSDYEGGELQLFTSSQPQVVKKQKGLIVVFPSYTVHQVTPVTKGTRQSLVAWVSGPRFK